MSIGWSKDSVTFGNIDTKVVDQLKYRKFISKKSNRNNNDLTFLNANTGWVKLSSGVEFKDEENFTTSDKATENILFSGVSSNTDGIKGGFEKNGSYSYSEQYGFKPMAGITEANIQTQGSFGEIKTAKVSFKVNSLQDLEKFERLFLLPGFSVLLEWGHSITLEKATTDVTDISRTIETYPDFFNPPSTPETDSENTEEQKQDATNQHRSITILDSINGIRTNSGFNYDALFGKVSNFIWNFTTDGYYDCAIDITGYGELAESISFLFSPNDSSEPEATSINPFKAYLETIIETEPKPCSATTKLGLIGDIDDVRDLDASESRKGINKAVKDNFEFIYTTYVSNSNGDEVPLKFITIGSLLNFINKYFVIKDEGKLFLKFYCGVYDNTLNDKGITNRTPFTTFDEHISYDLNKFLLPKSINSNDTKKRLALDIASSEELNKCYKGETNDILNIMVNVSYVKELFIGLLEESDSTAINIYSLLLTVMEDMGSSLGLINNFSFQEIDQVYHIVDKGTVPGDQEVDTVIDLFGLNSFVSNINLSSASTSDLSTIIAAGASSTNTAYTEKVFNLGTYYEQFVDRWVVTRSPSANKEETPDNKKDNTSKLQNNFDYLQTWVNNINGDKTILDDSSISNLKLAHKAVTDVFLDNTILKKETNSAGLIPISLSFDILGISGLKITDTFKIAPGLLPSRFDKLVGFYIVGLSHTIKDNQWVTSIEGQMMSLEKETEETVGTISLEENFEQIEEQMAIDFYDPEKFPWATRLRAFLKNGSNFGRMFVHEKVIPRRGRDFGPQLNNSGNDITENCYYGAIAMLALINNNITVGTIKLRIRITAGNDNYHAEVKKGSPHVPGIAFDIAPDWEFTKGNNREIVQSTSIERLRNAVQGAVRTYQALEYSGRTINSNFFRNKIIKFSTTEEGHPQNNHYLPILFYKDESTPALESEDSTGPHFHFDFGRAYSKPIPDPPGYVRDPLLTYNR